MRRSIGRLLAMSCREKFFLCRGRPDRLAELVWLVRKILPFKLQAVSDLELELACFTTAEIDPLRLC